MSKKKKPPGLVAPIKPTFNRIKEDSITFDFGQTIQKALNAFYKYQTELRPVQKQVFDILESQSGAEQTGLMALKEIIGLWEDLYNERQAAAAHLKEAALSETEFYEEMARSLTIAGNADHPTIISHILETADDQLLTRIFGALDFDRALKIAKLIAKRDARKNLEDTLRRRQ